MQPYEIVIAGAGPVGLATAALLAGGPAGEHLKIRLIDSSPRPQWNDADTDLRVYAVSAAAREVLADCGALDVIAARRMSPYEQMRVWEGATLESAAQLRFNSADIGLASLGHIVEDSLIRVALHAALERNCSVEMAFARQVESIDMTSRRVSLTLDGERSPLNAHLLIGADGAQSRVRAAAELPGVERDYAQQAIVAHIGSEHNHARTAWQRFLPGGPLALLPLADGRSSLVWSLPEAAAQQWMAADADQFSQRLTYASGNVLGGLRLASERVSLPLIARHAHTYCRPRLVLVGDAAHSVHPLAGQGVNLGLADAAELAHRISDAVIAGQDPGDLRVLRRYERARKGANLLMLGALDGLDRLFRAPRAFSPIRSAGLRVVDRMPLLKNQLIRHASGNNSS